MGALQLVAGLNWIMALLMAAVPIVMAVVGVPFSVVLPALLVALLLAAPCVYLALVIEKGRGRGLQTAISGLMLLAFPVGTLVGAWILHVLWFSEHRHLFEGGGGGDFADEDDEGANDIGPSESPWEYARRLKDEGLRVEEVHRRLVACGLDADEVETLLGAVGFPRASIRRSAGLKQKSAPPRRPRVSKGKSPGRRT